MNLKLKLGKLLLTFALMLSSAIVMAQVVGNGTYIKGNNVEIGINNLGGFEGTNATPVPAGMHPRGGGGFFGFVANPQLNAWATFNGDFFTPGGRENGWGLGVGNTAAGPNFGNNCAGTGTNSLLQIANTPSVSYSQVLNCSNVDWSGSVISGTTNIKAKINYFVQTNDLHYLTTVSLTNNSASVIPELYYYRNVDPDNNQSYPGGTMLFQTTNTIEDQPGFSACPGLPLACVSARQNSTAVMPASYMAFAAVGSDFRVSYGGFTNRNAFSIWNGIGFTQTLGASFYNDDAIQLSYKITNFLPGETRTFKFAVILSSANKAAAVNNLLSLSFPGSAYVAPSICSPALPPDTARTCGPTKIEIAGATSGLYSWTWNPPVATTFSAIVNPSVQTSYTITGIPTSTCVTPTPQTYTVVVIPSPPTPTVTLPSVTACNGSSVALTVTSGGAGATYLWAGPGGFGSALQTPTIAVTNATMAGTYTILVTLASGCTSTVLRDLIISSPPTVTLTSNTNTVCVSQPVILTGSGSSTYTWSPSSTLTFTTGSSTTASPSVTTTYTVVVGAGTCTNSAVKTITVIPTPTLTVSSATVCAGSVATLSVSGATSYLWSTGTTTNTESFSPSTTTTYTVLGANGGVCASVNSGTVNIVNYPVFNTATVSNVLCNGVSTGSILINATGATSYNWTPNVSTTNTATSLAAGAYTCVLSIAPSCSVVTTHTVTEPTVLLGAISYSNTSCGNCNGVATIIGSGGTGSYIYNWSPATSTLSGVIDLCPDLYTVSITDANNCVYTNTVDILPSPVFTATLAASNIALYQGESIYLTGLTGVSFTWTPDFSALDCYTCSIVKAQPYEDTRYCVDITTVDGCQDSDCIDISILCGDVFIPNAFSPNNDGYNDELGVYGNCINEVVFRVFDRWGAMMFEGKDTKDKWDGKFKGTPVSTGVYIYQLIAKLKNGETVSKTGNVTIIK
jgi:gliding motility-associated-like protein